MMFFPAVSGCIDFTLLLNGMSIVSRTQSFVFHMDSQGTKQGQKIEGEWKWNHSLQIFCLGTLPLNRKFSESR